jgi:hypothetical protein
VVLHQNTHGSLGVKHYPGCFVEQIQGCIYFILLFVLFYVVFVNKHVLKFKNLALTFGITMVTTLGCDCIKNFRSRFFYFLQFSYLNNTLKFNNLCTTRCETKSQHSNSPSPLWWYTSMHVGSLQFGIFPLTT